MSLVQHLHLVRVALALVGWVVIPGGASRSQSQTTTKVPLELVTASALAPGYRLQTLDVPPPPPDLTAGLEAPVSALEPRGPGLEPEVSQLLEHRAPPALSPEGACPLEVRAIVVAEDAAETFAMVTTERESVVVRKG